MTPQLKAKALELAERIEREITGWDEWMIMNRDETACCLTFNHRTSIDPEKEAEEAMSEQIKYYPESVEKNGYHVVKRRNYGRGIIAIEAAKVIRELING